MAYSLERVKDEFVNICRKANIECDPQVIRLNGRLTRTLGRVNIKMSEDGVWYSYSVEFSKQLIETATDESISSVIKHEAAHFIATERTGEDHGHDSYFKAVCAEIGTTNDTTKTKVERTVETSSIYKYEVFCPQCNKTIGGFSRMCKTIKEINLCHCKVCGSHDLKVTQNW